MAYGYPKNFFEANDVVKRISGIKLLYNERKKVCNKVIYFFTALYHSIGIMGNITTVSRLSVALKGNNTFESINMTCNEFASFTYYIPFFTATKWQCIISSTAMYLGMLFEAGSHAVHDGIFFGLIYYSKIQLQIIGDVFRTIRQRSLSKLNIPEDYSVLHDEENPALEEELYRQLSHSTEHLKILLRNSYRTTNNTSAELPHEPKPPSRAGHVIKILVIFYSVQDEIKQLFTYVLLAQIISMLFTLASFLYLVSTISINDPDIFLQFVCFMTILLQLTFFCWSGNGITEGFDSINTALYESEWLSCSRRFKKSMILTMTRLQRPVLLSLGGFSPLTLATLVGVCQGSFSYFTLFQSYQ